MKDMKKTYFLEKPCEMSSRNKNLDLRMEAMKKNT